MRKGEGKRKGTARHEPEKVVKKEETGNDQQRKVEEEKNDEKGESEALE